MGCYRAPQKHLPGCATALALCCLLGSGCRQCLDLLALARLEIKSPEGSQVPGEGEATSVPAEGCEHLGGLGSPGEMHDERQVGQGMRSPVLEVDELQYGDETKQSLR